MLEDTVAHVLFPESQGRRPWKQVVVAGSSPNTRLGHIVQPDQTWLNLICQALPGPGEVDRLVLSPRGVGGRCSEGVRPWRNVETLLGEENGASLKGRNAADVAGAALEPKPRLGPSPCELQAMPSAEQNLFPLQSWAQLHEAAPSQERKCSNRKPCRLQSSACSLRRL